MIRDVRRCLELLPRRLRARWALLAVLLAATALAESAGALAIFVLIRAAIAGPGGADAIPAALRAHLPPAVQGFGAVVGLVGLFFFAKNGAIALTADAQSRLVAGSMDWTFERLHAGYLAAPLLRLLGKSAASRIHTLHVAIDTAFRVGMTAAAGIVAESLVVAGLTAVLLLKAPLPALGAVALFVVVLAGFSLASARAAVRWGRQEDQGGEEILAGLREELDGMREIKIYGGEAYFQALVGARFRRRLDAQRRHITLLAMPRIIVETAFVGAALILVALISGGEEAHGAALPVLGLFAYAGFRMIPSANRILYLSGLFRHCRAAILRVSADARRFPAPAGAADPPPARVPAGPLSEGIELRDVTFRYPGEARPALSHLDLRIRPGERVGVVGPTGSGKSTLADVLAGLLEPETGSVLADGVDVRDPRAAWTRRVGYVPQAPHLIDDTLAANVAFGVDASAIDRLRVEDCLRTARLAEVVAALPRGLDTILGEKGSRLSGGERQRVAIARALYRDPELLVLDEATSALDPRTEAHVRDGILALPGSRTVVFIAHRFSLVSACPRLLVVRSGRIVADGPREELLGREPFLADMAAGTPTVAGAAEGPP